MNCSVGKAKRVKRFERSNGLDTALYKNYIFFHSLTLTHTHKLTHKPRHGGEGGATTVLVRSHDGHGGAAAIPLWLAQTAVALRKFWTCSKSPPCHREGSLLRRSMTEPLRPWRFHCGLCRTSTAMAPRLWCDGGITYNAFVFVMRTILIVLAYRKIVLFNRKNEIFPSATNLGLWYIRLESGWWTWRFQAMQHSLRTTSWLPKTILALPNTWSLWQGASRSFR